MYCKQPLLRFNQSSPVPRSLPLPCSSWISSPTFQSHVTVSHSSGKKSSPAIRDTVMVRSWSLTWKYYLMVKGWSPTTEVAGHAFACNNQVLRNTDYCEYLNIADINECEFPGRCPANSSCTNTEGSFNCTCNSGFLTIAQGCEGKMPQPDMKNISVLVGLLYSLSILSAIEIFWLAL